MMRFRILFTSGLVLTLVGLQFLAIGSEVPDLGLSKKTYLQLQTEEREVLDAMKQNAFDKASIHRDRKKTELLLETSESFARKRAQVLAQAALQKTYPHGRKIAQAMSPEEVRSCDQACLPEFVSASSKHSCSLADFAASGVLTSSEVKKLQIKTIALPARKETLERALQGEPRTCLHLYYRANRDIAALSEKCQQTIQACPIVEKAQQYLAKLENQLEQAQKDLKQLAELDEGNLQELLAVRTEMRNRASHDPKLRPPSFVVPDFHVNQKELVKRAPANENVPTEIAPPTAEPPIISP